MYLAVLNCAFIMVLQKEPVWVYKNLSAVKMVITCRKTHQSQQMFIICIITLLSLCFG